MAWKRKHGAFAGMSAEWTAYRYGSPTPKCVPRKRLLSGRRRADIVEQVVAILNGFRLSPFEFEGAVRAGLRSGFCLDGARWLLSDIEADEILQEGLRRIGAKRPTWAEGQREATDPNVFCKWCGTELTDDMFDGNRTGIFCSNECGAASFEHRRTRDNWRESAVSRKAYRAALKKQKPTRTCQQCGKAFHPENVANEKNVFCSPNCRGKSMITVPLRPCIECGKEFRPQSTKIPGMFCSNNCRNSHAKRKLYEVECVYCGTVFRAATPEAEYCTSNHANLARRARLRIEEADRTGVPFIPTGKNKAFVQRVIDAHRVATNSVASPADEPAPAPVLHALFDAARRAPALHRPLTAAVFDDCFARAA